MNKMSNHSLLNLKSWTVFFLFALATTPSSAYQSSTLEKTQTKEFSPVVLVTELDQNGDGVLNYPEFSAKAPKRFSIQDTDGDGGLTFEEFYKHNYDLRKKNKKKITQQRSNPRMTGTHQDKLPRNRAKRLFSQFSLIDIDNDGQLSADEIHESQFLRLDTNKNGVLEVSELSMEKKRRLTSKKRHENSKNVEMPFNRSNSFYRLRKC
jgi:Ca2+-binding EF-hand superfamily protein